VLWLFNNKGKGQIISHSTTYILSLLTLDTCYSLNRSLIRPLYKSK